MHIQNHHNINPNIFALMNFVYIVVFILRCHVKAAQDDITTKTVPELLFVGIADDVYIGATVL